MDPSIAWLQPEQDGPAKAVWLRLWSTQKDFDNMNITNGDCDTDSLNSCVSLNSQSTVSLTNGVNSDKSMYYANRRRKIENRASTKGMNFYQDAIVGEYGGCPWRQKGFNYQRGVIG